MHSRLDCHKLWGCFASASSPSFLDPFLVREKWIEAEIENKKPPECCAVRMIKLDHGYCVSDLQKSLSSNHGIHSDEIILARSPMAVFVCSRSNSRAPILPPHPTWDWVPEFAFAEGVLARFAAAESVTLSETPPDFEPSPFLCSFLDFARTYFKKLARAPRGDGVTDIP